MEPSSRQIKFFDTITKLQMFESLNFVQKKIQILKSKHPKKYSASVGIISEGKKWGRYVAAPVLAALSTGVTVFKKH